MPPQGGRKHPHQEFIQIDTTNILFICGGAFDGLEKIIESRIGEKTMGFNSTIGEREQMNVGEILKQVMPQDLVRFGMIPEFIGRVPVTVTLDALDEESLIRILTAPKNAIVKQYIRLFEMDGVRLSFTKGSLRAMAQKAIRRNTGARGLRAIMEDSIMDLMYEAPSDPTIESIEINEDVINKTGKASVVYRESQTVKQKADKAATRKTAAQDAEEARKKSG